MRFTPHYDIVVHDWDLQLILALSGVASWVHCDKNPAATLQGRLCPTENRKLAVQRRGP